MDDKPLSLLESEIVSKFPDQFRGGEIPLSIDIGDGWKIIVLDACRQMQEALSEDELRQFHWTQIKQKWGRLKMYWQPRSRVTICCAAPDGKVEFEHIAQREISDEVRLSAFTQALIDAVIDQATERASCTCESCGSTGRLRDGHCVRVLCDACANA